MSTLVGTQDDFSKAIKELIELEYDTVGAYEAAVARLDNGQYRDKINSFLADHLRHITALSQLLSGRGEEVPQGSSGTGWIAKGKVIMANLVGDKTILAAMMTNELDTNTAYERLDQRTDKWSESIEVIQGGLEDERSHKEWLEATLKTES